MILVSERVLRIMLLKNGTTNIFTIVDKDFKFY